MNLVPFAFLHSNAELANYARTNSRFASVAELRKSVPIAVIDDEKFVAEDNLRNQGYKIAQLGDIKSVDEVRDYRIVLCDLMGVGRYFDDQKQGASIIEEIRTNYPATIVVAYSGASLSSLPARTAKLLADKLIKKDIDTSEWKDTLDQLARMALDPAFVWSRMRQRLVATDVDTKVIMVLEDAYVRSVINKDKSGGRLTRAAATLNVSADVRGVIQSLVASAIFAILVG